MPEPPRTGDAVLDLVRKSELADDDTLSAFLRQAGPLPPTAADTVSRLIKAGVLTQFQARAILQGKHRGFRLGPYKILDQIGAGGMGQVFLAEHAHMRRRVALKVLPPKLAADKAGVERFYREARAVAALDHPNIIRAHDVAIDKGTHFLVLEYIEGQSLTERMAAAGGVLPAGEACGYVVQAAAGLQHAHEKGLAHRDIKPGNLLVDREGLVKILDMGLARFFEDEGDRITRNLEPGGVMGTADYVAPEQLMDCSAADHRADIYSLGATLYHLVTGRPPFDGPTTAKLVAHQLKPVPPAHSVRADVPEEVSAVIERMMAKNPDDRYQSASEVVAALLPHVGTAPGPMGMNSGKIPPIAAAAISQSTANLQAAMEKERQERVRLEQEKEAARQRLRRKKRLALFGLLGVILAGGGIVAAVALTRDDPNPVAKGDAPDEEDPKKAGPGQRPPPETPDVLTLAFKLDAGKANVEAALFTPDDRFLVTSGSDKLVRVWDAAGGKHVRNLEGHTNNVRALSLYPDGRRLVSASHDKTLRLWDVHAGTCLRTFEGHAVAVVGVAALPDGRRFLSSANDGAVWLWDAETKEVLKKYDPAPLPVYGLAVTRDGRRAVAGTWDMKRNAAKPADAAKLAPVGVWAFEIDTGKRLRDQPSDTSVSHIRVSADGRLAVFGTNTGVTTWDIDTGSFRAFTGVAKRTTAAAFTRDGRHVLSTGYDNALTLWDAATGRAVAGEGGMAGQGYFVAPSHDGKRVAVVGANGTAGVWKLPANVVPRPNPANLPEPAATLTSPAGGLEDVVFSPDGTRVIGAANPGKQLGIWDAATGADVGRIALPDAAPGCRGLALLPNDRVASCVPGDPFVRVWDVKAGTQIRQLGADKVTGFVSVAALPDGRLLATASDKSVRQWNPDADQSVARFDVKADCRGLAATPDGTRILVGCGDKSLRLWGVPEKRELRKISLPAVAWRVGVSPDGKWAGVGGDKTVHLWHLDTGELRALTGADKPLDGVAFTREGRFVLAGGADRALHVWEVATARYLGRVYDHPAAVRAVTLSPDGKQVVTGSTDGTAVVWRLPEALWK